MNNLLKHCPLIHGGAGPAQAPRLLGRGALAFTLIAVQSVTIFSGCREKTETPSATPSEVEVVVVEQKDVPIYRDWVGTLEGEVNATISAQVSGYLLSRNYTEGTLVTNGQVLFQIDPAPFKADLNKAQSQLAQAQATQEKYALNVKRYTPLAKSQAISQQELEDAIQNEKAAQANVQAAQAAAQAAQLNLDFTTIRSPVDGMAGLASDKAQIGNLVGPGSGTLTTVATIDPIRVYVSVSQALITQRMERRLVEGKTAGGEVDEQASPQLELVLTSGAVYPSKGRVRYANNQVDVKTGTVRVVGEFPNPQRLLVPGMFVRVRALLDTVKNALVVPQRAVTDMQGRYLVAVVGADNKVNVRPVTAGERFGQQWVISGNLKAGERVVAEGIQKVRDGAIVNPVPFSEKSASVAPPAATAAEEKKP